MNLFYARDNSVWQVAKSATQQAKQRIAFSLLDSLFDSMFDSSLFIHRYHIDYLLSVGRCQQSLKLILLFSVERPEER